MLEDKEAEVKKQNKSFEITTEKSLGIELPSLLKRQVEYRKMR